METSAAWNGVGAARATGDLHEALQLLGENLRDQLGHLLSESNVTPTVWAICILLQYLVQLPDFRAPLIRKLTTVASSHQWATGVLKIHDSSLFSQGH